MKTFVDPGNVIIEKTAGEFCATFWEAARSSGLTIINLQGKKINLLRYKDARAFARRHLEAFIPAAVHALTEILSRENTPPEQKEIIYNALMERVNDKDINMMGKTAGLPEFENVPAFKDDTEKPKPLMIKTDAFNFSSKRK